MEHVKEHNNQHLSALSEISKVCGLDFDGKIALFQYMRMHNRIVDDNVWLSHDYLNNNLIFFRQDDV